MTSNQYKIIYRAAIVFLVLSSFGFIFEVISSKDSHYIAMLAISAFSALSLSMLFLLVFNRLSHPVDQQAAGTINDDVYHEAINELNRISCSVEQTNDSLIDEILKTGCKSLGMTQGRISYINLMLHSNTVTKNVMLNDDSAGNENFNAALPGKEGLETFVSSSIVINKNFYGTVSFLCSLQQKRNVTQEDRNLVNIISSTIASILERDVADQLIQAKNAKEIDIQDRGAFVRNLSHELRTPLTAILGYSDLLLEDALENGRDDIMKDLRNIKHASSNLLSLVNDVLDISSLECDRDSLKLENLPSEIIIKEVAEVLRPMLEKNRNQLKVDIQTNLGFIHTDANKYRQILVNLVSTINKLVSSNTIRLEADRVIERERDSEMIVFRIIISGDSDIFSQLQRYLNARSLDNLMRNQSEFGAGLGLYICRHYCRVVGGEVRVEENNQQSIVHVRLPVNYENANDVESYNEYGLMNLAC